MPLSQSQKPIPAPAARRQARARRGGKMIGSNLQSPANTPVTPAVPPVVNSGLPPQGSQQEDTQRWPTPPGMDPETADSFRAMFEEGEARVKAICMARRNGSVAFSPVEGDLALKEDPGGKVKIMLGRPASLRAAVEGRNPHEGARDRLTSVMVTDIAGRLYADHSVRVNGITIADDDSLSAEENFQVQHDHLLGKIRESLRDEERGDNLRAVQWCRATSKVLERQIAQLEDPDVIPEEDEAKEADEPEEDAPRSALAELAAKGKDAARPARSEHERREIAARMESLVDRLREVGEIETMALALLGAGAEEDMAKLPASDTLQERQSRHTEDREGVNGDVDDSRKAANEFFLTSEEPALKGDFWPFLEPVLNLAKALNENIRYRQVPHAPCAVPGAPSWIQFINFADCTTQTTLALGQETLAKLEEEVDPEAPALFGQAPPERKGTRMLVSAFLVSKKTTETYNALPMNPFPVLNPEDDVIFTVHDAGEKQEALEESMNMLKGAAWGGGLGSEPNVVPPETPLCVHNLIWWARNYRRTVEWDDSERTLEQGIVDAFRSERHLVAQAPAFAPPSSGTGANTRYGQLGHAQDRSRPSAGAGAGAGAGI